MNKKKNISCLRRAYVKINTIDRQKFLKDLKKTNKSLQDSGIQEDKFDLSLKNVCLDNCSFEVQMPYLKECYTEAVAKRAKSFEFRERIFESVDMKTGRNAYVCAFGTMLLHCYIDSNDKYRAKLSGSLVKALRGSNTENVHINNQYDLLKAISKIIGVSMDDLHTTKVEIGFTVDLGTYDNVEAVIKKAVCVGGKLKKQKLLGIISQAKWGCYDGRRNGKKFVSSDGFGLKIYASGQVQNEKARQEIYSNGILRLEAVFKANETAQQTFENVLTYIDRLKDLINAVVWSNASNKIKEALQFDRIEKEHRSNWSGFDVEPLSYIGCDEYMRAVKAYRAKKAGFHCFGVLIASLLFLMQSIQLESKEPQNAQFEAVDIVNQEQASKQANNQSGTSQSYQKR